MNTIAEKWAEFAGEGLAPNATEAERAALLTVFHVGFRTCLTMVFEAGEKGATAVSISSLYAESTAFFEQLGKSTGADV